MDKRLMDVGQNNKGVLMRACGGLGRAGGTQARRGHGHVDPLPSGRSRSTRDWDDGYRG